MNKRQIICSATTYLQSWRSATCTLGTHESRPATFPPRPCVGHSEHYPSPVPCGILNAIKQTWVRYRNKLLERTRLAQKRQVKRLTFARKGDVSKCFTEPARHFSTLWSLASKLLVFVILHNRRIWTERTLHQRIQTSLKRVQRWNFG